MEINESEFFFIGLNYAMHKRSMNDSKLAEMSGFMKQYVSLIRRGKRGLTDENMGRLAGAVGFLTIDLINLGKRIESAAQITAEENWEKKYHDEVKAHKETLKELADARKKLLEASTTPTVSDMGTVTSISDLGAGIKAEKE